MLDKFLNKITSKSSYNTSINQKIADYNQDVIEKKKVLPIDSDYSELTLLSLANTSQKNQKFQKQSPEFKRPNTYQSFDTKKTPREYPDDGSYFCSYAMGGNILICLRNKEKSEITLDNIFHPDKNNYLAKRANYFLNDLVKKKKVYLTEKENGLYDVFLESDKENSINDLLIKEGFNDSRPKLNEKKTSFSKPKIIQPTITSENDEEDEKKDTEVKEKKNYAYGLFATNHNTFEALFNKNKITLKLDGLNLDSISKEDQKICKSMIYDFVSKKSIILNFKSEENGIHFVEVFNKEGEHLNSLIATKNFKILSNTTIVEESLSPSTSEHQDSDDNENLIQASDNQDSSGEMDVPEVTVLPAMFKKGLSSNPNSPFAKKNITSSVVESKISSVDEEVNVPEVTVLPAMLKKGLTSNPNSPFAKKNSGSSVIDSSLKISENSNVSTVIESIEIQKKSSFGKR